MQGMTSYSIYASNKKTCPACHQDFTLSNMTNTPGVLRSYVLALDETVKYLNIDYATIKANSYEYNFAYEKLGK